MSQSNSQEIISRLQAAICAAIDPHFPASRQFALLDFPNYTNVGDSAIWLGEIEYFRQRHNARPVYVSQIFRHSSDELRRYLPEGTIFINGGGNFGDLWTLHQDFREKIIQEFPNRKIVQLPVSIHYGDADRLKQSAAIINAHPDFTLMVRDNESLKIAQDNFTCKIVLCPDMAFMLGLQPDVAPQRDLLLLLRTDSEKQKGSASGLANLPPAEDWLIEPANTHTLAKMKGTLASLLGFNPARLSRPALREQYFFHLATARLQRGLRQIQSAKFVITDRLHTHILSLLCNRPHIALDNSYGKIGNFMRAWTADSNIASRADTLEQAAALYQQRNRSAA